MSTKTAKQAAEVRVDLSEEIIASVGKRPGEQVKCMRVWDDNYRVSWISNLTGKVRSQFLQATKTADGLVIVDKTIDKPARFKLT